MKRGLLSIFFLIFFLGFPQLKVKVVGDTTHKAVFKVKSPCNNTAYTSEGIPEFNYECKNIDIDTGSYQRERIIADNSIEGSPLRKYNKTTNIEAVFIESKSDPRALKILKKVNKLF